MADNKSPEERSKNMSKIRSKDTKPEVWFRKTLFAQGYRYRKHVKNIYGHPDLWLAKYNTVIFVHGCFWHRHRECKYAYTPKSRVEFWSSKFNNNIKRDAAVKQILTASGIKVLIIWECTINQMRKNESWKNEIIEKVERFLASEEIYSEL